MQDGSVFFVRPDDIVHDTIEGETVVIDLRNGVYFRFDGAATHAWTALLDGATEIALVDRVAAAYAGSREAIAAGVHDFLIALYRDGVIRRDDASAAAPDRAAAGPRPGEAHGEAARPGSGVPTQPDAAAGAPFVGLPLERFDQLRPLVGGPAEDKLPFDGLTLSRFEDLDELLMLDPVHEVEDTGWPHRQAAD